MIIITEAEAYHYGDKILTFIEKDEELSKLSPEGLVFILTGVIYNIGFEQGKLYRESQK